MVYNYVVKKILIAVSAWKYKWIWKPIFFCFDPEKVHNLILNVGEILGKIAPLRGIIAGLWQVKSPALEQTLAEIHFPNPMGLSAGFDYKAKLTRILPSVGFGFGSIGTITNEAYEGNPGPRLGRLKKSRSLLVNKGFKNKGVRVIISKLENYKFSIPIGISIGNTNKADQTQDSAVSDVVAAFRIVEDFHAPFVYYELNISCPNLKSPVSFYPSENLKALLAAVFAVKLTRPLFIKMPISEPDEEVKKMLDTAAQFPVAGVIFGNLQKDRTHPDLIPSEVAVHGKGNFSGKPTEKRSNELIGFAYKHYGNKLVIIGSGGVFSAEDAYKKIKLGASLVQLITGIIYEGPQLIAQINLGLLELLKKDGFKHISEAVGADMK